MARFVFYWSLVPPLFFLGFSSGASEYPDKVFWGDTHIHTALSGDASAAGVALDLEAAYRFAKGEVVLSNTGIPAKLDRPLDFVVIADHANNLGAAFYRDLYQRDEPFRNSALGKAWLKAKNSLIEGHFSEEKLAKSSLLPAHRSWQASLRDPDFRRLSWSAVVDAADYHNNPGEFTAFVGYEWTPGPEQGSADHRVVVFESGGEEIAELLPFTSYDSAYEEDLWRYLDRAERSSKKRAMAIPHNSNLTNGQMFRERDSWGLPITEEYSRTRARFEKVVEVTQIKGDSETHPFISPSDEFADFERWNGWGGWLTNGLFRGQPIIPRPESLIQYEYIRPALQRGLSIADKSGTNPFQFGLIGSSDTHTGLSAVDDSNFFGKSAPAEPSAVRFMNKQATYNWQMNAAGLAAVWAKDNTRGEIFNALSRREVYATTGPRISLRFFGGYDFLQQDLDLETLVASGYEKGIPMGGELNAKKDAPPSFLFAAMKDPRGANLDRLQIVKGWIENGEMKEKVFNVAWSDERPVDEEGNITPVGNTVNLEEATWTDTVGDASLIGIWSDPEHNPSKASVYYARVLQIPTPRWTLYDKVRFGIKDMDEEIPLVTQERAYSSPIWYKPKKKS